MLGLVTPSPEVEFLKLAVGIEVLVDVNVRGSASICPCRLLDPGELGTELAVTGSRGVYAPLSGASILLTFVLKDRSRTEVDDFRVAGLDGRENELLATDDDEADNGGDSGRVE